MPSRHIWNQWSKEDTRERWKTQIKKGKRQEEIEDGDGKTGSRRRLGKKTGRRNCEGEVKVEMKRDGGVGKKKR